jgi:hypothetical protein
MNTKEKIEELKFAIGRFDHYYDSVNNKGNLYLAINTFILGGVIAGYETLDAKNHFGKWIILLFVLTLASNLLSFWFTLTAVRPYYNKSHKAKSAVFFSDVSEFNKSQYELVWENMNESKWQQDLIAQSKLLAAGLTKKFSALKKATGLIAIEIILIILFSIYLLLTY